MSTMYPMCEKFNTVKEKSQTISDFIDWMATEHDAEFCKRPLGHTEEVAQRALGTYNSGTHAFYYPIHKNREALFAEFFGIDLDIVEKEQRTMLDSIRKENSKTP